ncbi:hypothetical protein CI102_2434 [Trichoderma harzianum]|nr:hypothetical protein CI102_2434 [Trichoderma harzianum]
MNMGIRIEIARFTGRLQHFEAAARPFNDEIEKLFIASIHKHQMAINEVDDTIMTASTATPRHCSATSIG